MTIRDWKTRPQRRDWRKPTDYSSLHNATKEALAWEFLRRNESYRSAAQKAAAPEFRVKGVKRNALEIHVTDEHREAGRWGLLYFC